MTFWVLAIGPAFPETYSDAVLRLGATAYWKLNENTGNTIADSSGNGYTGTMENMESTDWVSGQSASALSFDGVNERITLGTTNFTTGTSSLALWVLPNISQSKPFGEFLIDNTGMCLYQTGTSISMVFRGASDQFRTEGGLNIGQWNHLVFVYSGGSKSSSGSYSMYINGVAMALHLPGAGPVGGAFVKNYLAYESSNLYFNGKMDEVAIFDTNLSSSQVSDLYQTAITPVPEASTLFLLFLGLSGLLGFTHTRKLF